ncbi:transcription factor [Ganoderma sinense ZZ0214-1]|uniref:Transcription factor n=1 Tax=Ganoderma sinense ZZ0214-1 TaxID=1077348 RepID=A0A2G8RUZ9_9APHY|nr:transcription factor [Ganoderma sinense ZZ0214-1]
MPHPNSGDYVVSWLDTLSVQGAGWLPEFYTDPPRPSHYSPDTRPFVDHAFDAFAPSFHQEPSTMHHYQTHMGASVAHSNSPVNTLYRHNAYTPIVSVSHRGPSPVFYEEHSPPLPLVQSFPDFGFVDADSVPSLSSASSVTDTESISASESRRRQKSKIALAADQPLTVDGKPRERVYVACDRCRLRKLRCDGGQPSCFNCERVADQGVFCCYESAPRRRGQDKAPRIRSPVGQRKPRRPAVRKARATRLS